MQQVESGWLTAPTPYPRSVSNRFPGKSCVLCPSPSVGVGEHVWSRWLIRDFHRMGPFKTEKSGVPYTKRDGVTPVTMAALPGAHVPMCEPCNAVLNRSIEVPAKPVVRRLLPWETARGWPIINADEAAALARWLLKTGLLAAHPEARHDNPYVAREPEFPRFDHMDPAWLGWMRTGSAPPNGFSIYVTRRSLKAELPWKGVTQRIFLPRRIVLGNKELHFMARSFGVSGMDVTIVWHPGWPILHPLLENHKLAVLWPEPTDVDFASLPEVHPRAFSFVVGLDSRIMADSDFIEATKVPLSVDCDSLVQFFGGPDFPG